MQSYINKVDFYTIFLEIIFWEKMLYHFHFKVRLSFLRASFQNFIRNLPAMLVCNLLLTVRIFFHCSVTNALRAVSCLLILIVVGLIITHHRKMRATVFILESIIFFWKRLIHLLTIKKNMGIAISSQIKAPLPLLFICSTDKCLSLGPRSLWSQGIRFPFKGEISFIIKTHFKGVRLTSFVPSSNFLPFVLYRTFKWWTKFWNFFWTWISSNCKRSLYFVWGYITISLTGNLLGKWGWCCRNVVVFLHTVWINGFGRRTPNWRKSCVDYCLNGDQVSISTFFT